MDLLWNFTCHIIFFTLVNINSETILMNNIKIREYKMTKISSQLIYFGFGLHFAHFNAFLYFSIFVFFSLLSIFRDIQGKCITHVL